ncbi:MAG: DUF218 domain-containing protein [Chloroflexi bacterium]|nr:DUF218 domain-containing protein [Chloroflexota bacterium]
MHDKQSTLLTRQAAKHWGTAGLFGLLGLLALTAGVGVAYTTSYRKLIYSASNVPVKPVAIVFGAGVWRDGTLSPILLDRVETAIELYQAERVSKLLMTGDNRYIDYNEPQAMANYAISRGIPCEDIVLDFAGRRTYDSCYRAAYIFEVQEAILVTQAYHLPRALYTARHLGIDAVGVAADRQSYQFMRQYQLREVTATLVAWWQVMISKPIPVLGPVMPIIAEKS